MSEFLHVGSVKAAATTYSWRVARGMWQRLGAGLVGRGRVVVYGKGIVTRVSRTVFTIDEAEFVLNTH